MRVQGCGVLLTGASGGIGRALALALAQRRCRLALVARNPELLHNLAQEVKAQGGEAAVFPADVSELEAMEDVAKKAETWLGAWRVVIANAGVGYHGPALDGSVHDQARVWHVNFLGVVNTLRAARPYLQRPAGLGVVSSLSALIPYRGGAFYGASKAGLNAFLRCLRLEVRNEGTTVGWLCPGPVDTPMILDGVPYRKLPRLARMLVPVLAPGKVAESLLRLLERGGGQKIIPWQAAFFASFYRHFPQVAEALLRLSGAGEA